MKIPTRNTCAHAICELIYTTGNRSMGELISDLGRRYTRETLKLKADDLEDRGLIIYKDGRFENSSRMIRYFEACEEDLVPAKPKPPGITATPRTPPEFKAMTRTPPAVLGSRAGSNDYRTWPSRQLP